MLLTISDDAWFGHSLASWQHLEIARVRALETGRYLLASSNNGVTAFIDNTGRIQKILPQYVRAVLSGTVQPMTGSTPWVRFGDNPWLILMVLSLLVLAWRSRD